MSDTREDAAQELAAAGIQSGVEDALGSSLSSSFAPPATATPPRPASEVGTTQAAGAAAPEAEAESTPVHPVPGMEEWKETLDAYNEEWRKEADIAREKAIRNRKFYEDQAEAETKSKRDEAAAKKKRDAQEKRDKEAAEKLRKELAGEIPVTGGSGSAAGIKKKKEDARVVQEEREKKVKEAWHMVQAASASDADKAEGKGAEVVTDSRGVMPQDIMAGQAELEGEHRSKPQQTMYDPTTSSEPLPPSMQEKTPSPPVSMPSESQTLSRHSATSQAWTEVSGSSSAEDLSPPASGTSSGFTSEEGQKPRGIKPTELRGNAGACNNLPAASASGPSSSDPDPEKGESKALVPQSSPQSQNQPPAQPPSLTLSLFSSPSNLSVSRLVAVLGINLVLPFINGVMLGFGEIFAREAVRVGRLVIRGERSLFGSGRRSWGDAEQGQARGQAAGRGVAGVGLSGSGGFP